MLERDEESKC
ncbi:Protein of unknown function [Bacillus cereus]|nr:Protein of unknown function [Bacillus cereus]